MRPPLRRAALVLDAAAGAGWLAVLVDGRLLARRDWTALRDATSRLPALASSALASAGVDAGALDHVAVVAGPGSFTGLRASFALAHGLALASGTAVVAVGAAEADDGSGARTPSSVAAAAARLRAVAAPGLGSSPLYDAPAQARAAPVRPPPR